MHQKDNTDKQRQQKIEIKDHTIEPKKRGRGAVQREKKRQKKSATEAAVEDLAAK